MLDVCNTIELAFVFFVFFLMRHHRLLNSMTSYNPCLFLMKWSSLHKVLNNRNWYNIFLYYCYQGIYAFNIFIFMNFLSVWWRHCRFVMQLIFAFLNSETQQCKNNISFFCLCHSFLCLFFSCLRLWSLKLGVLDRPPASCSLSHTHLEAQPCKWWVMHAQTCKQSENHSHTTTAVIPQSERTMI